MEFRREVSALSECFAFVCEALDRKWSHLVDATLRPSCAHFTPPPTPPCLCQPNYSVQESPWPNLSVVRLLRDVLVSVHDIHLAHFACLQL